MTRAALEWEHGRAIVERASRLSIPVVELASDRLTLELPEHPGQAYAAAKHTLAVTVAPPSKLKLQPIAPSADFRLDLAEGCPAHCSYCYLAGSLKGAPITRVYANLPEIFAALPNYLGLGRITSKSRQRKSEGTTFEASCYTDPLAIEPMTGSLSALVKHFATWNADVQLRFTSKFDGVEPLLQIAHQGRTRMRFSLNPAPFAPFEAGTAPVAKRLLAMRRMAQAGYKIGLTIAPILFVDGWQRAYSGLLADVALALHGLQPDLTVELITHRYTPGSKAVLESWYPRSKLDLSLANRTEKRTKFGAKKLVYDASTQRLLRAHFESELARQLPSAKLLYWT